MEITVKVVLSADPELITHLATLVEEEGGRTRPGTRTGGREERTCSRSRA